MLLPMDDHMVHRGDGVFEAIKAVDRKIFLMKEHLNRLQASAASIGIQLPMPVPEMQDLILQTLKVADHPNVLIRLFVSRGPGGFTTNPYESVGSQLYLAITELRSPKSEVYQKGVRIGRSAIPVKETWMAQVKSCNYLPNVMMKKEAVDRKLDFTIAFDRGNYVAESSTENIAILDQNGVLTHPPFEGILKGTTMIRAFQLAESSGLKTAIRNFREEEIQNAREVFMIGTTLDVLPVTEYEGRPIADGKVGAVAQKLLQLVRQEFQNGTSF
jgi:branched-chain amino acid aminotransferase